MQSDTPEGYLKVGKADVVFVRPLLNSNMKIVISTSSFRICDNGKKG